MRCWLKLSGLLVLLVLLPVQGQVVLSEFMADNASTLADEDGDFEDWIEVRNLTSAPVSLQGWRLTDSAGNPAKWTFPAMTLAAGGHLVVFASSKDRRAAGAELHTNFKLSSGGEYLALVRSNGTVATAFSPAYPPQIPDVAYGLALQGAATALVHAASAARYRIPAAADAVHEGVWMTNGFAEAGWSNGAASVGFETGAPEFGAAAVDALLADEPVGYWRLQETNGLVAYNLGLVGSDGNGACLNGATQRVTGVRPPGQVGYETNNSARRFVRGSSHKIDVPYDAGLNPPSFTAELWARPLATGTQQSPLTSRQGSPRTGYYFYLSSGNVWQFVTGNGGGADYLSASSAITTGQWYHLVGTYDAPTRVKRFFINGALIGTVSNTVAVNASQPLRIGAGATEGTGNYWFGGEVDEVAVFARALTPAEVTSHYQRAASGGTNAFYAGLYQTNLRAPMHGSNATAWLRIPFVLDDAAVASEMALRVRYDDGFAAWLNGLPVAFGNAPAPLGWNAQAPAAAATADARSEEPFDLSAFLPLLQPGTNLLALQALNVAASNPDLLLAPTLELTVITNTGPAYFTTPTPGAANGAGLAEPGPLFYGETVSPAQPTTNDDLAITVRVQPALAAVSNVLLRWQVMFGAATQTNLLDDGLHGDGLAGDGVYGALIPRTAYTEGQLVRWYFAATDLAGRTNRWPLFADPLNSPERFGAMIEDRRFTTALPVWYWFTTNTAGAATRTGVRGSVWFDGAYYDNVFIRLRGGATSINSKKFDFNTGYHCRISDEVGRVEEANLNGGSSYDGTLTRPPLAFETLRAAGHPAEACFSVLLRVNAGADRLGYYVEQPDERFLDRWGLDRNGALYKFDQRSAMTPAYSDNYDGVEKKTRLFENNDDLLPVVAALTNRADRVNLERFMFDHFDLANMANYLACRALYNDFDDCRKNWYFYRDTEGSQEWMLLPWDKDGTFGIQGDAGAWWPHPLFGDEAHLKANASQWSFLWDALFNTPRARDRYLRRLRTLMDTFLQTQPGYLEARANALWEPVYPHKGGTNTAVTAWLPTRRTQLYNTYSITNPVLTNALIPLAQAALPAIVFGAADLNPASGNQDEEYLALVNTNAVSVDLSGWSVTGGVRHTFRAGTVVLAGETMYLARHVRAFRARSVSPKGGEFRYVQGDYAGALSARGDAVYLRDAAGVAVASASYAAASPSLVQQFLRVTELMADPAPAAGSAYDAQEFEYIELRNTSDHLTLDLTGVRFSNGVTYAISGGAGASVPPGSFVVLARNAAAYAERYPTNPPPAGVYTGALDNAGEDIRLEDGVGEKILDFTYDPDAFPLTAGLGFSLVIRDDAGDWSTWGDPVRWRASASRGGSPGLPDPEPPDRPGVLINELLSHTDPPLVDAVELYNTNDAPVDVGGWWLTDDVAAPLKFRIPDGTLVPARGHLVFDETDFNTPSNAPGSFTFASTGDDVWLFSADAQSNLTGFVAGQDFGAAPNAVSFGRHVNSVDDYFFVLQSARSLDETNAYPQVGPLVLTEVHYHPVDDGTNANTRDEFVELLNNDAAPLSLSDPLFPTNRWRLDGAVRYTFPTGTLLAAQGRILVVGFDPLTNASLLGLFRTNLAVPTNAIVLGPWTGVLDNAGERITLLQPDPPNSNEVPYVVRETVTYAPTNPWPAQANGAGASLQRINAAAFGDDPINWYPATPTPGVASDVHADADGDGASDWEEWLGGTDPSNALSRFEFTAVTGAEHGVVFTWPSAPGKAYAIERATNLAEAPAFLIWRESVPAQGAWTRQFETNSSGAAQIFRIRLTRP
jgi:hypothetical protein